MGLEFVYPTLRMERLLCELFAPEWTGASMKAVQSQAGRLRFTSARQEIIELLLENEIVQGIMVFDPLADRYPRFIGAQEPSLEPSTREQLTRLVRNIPALNSKLFVSANLLLKTAEHGRRHRHLRAA
jgi:hypothetical protein